MFLWRPFFLSLKTAVFLTSPSLTAVFSYLWLQLKKIMNDTCEKIHKNILRRRGKGRYRSASLTVEAAVAFPVFFFAVLYLLQMFSVLRAELVIAEGGITSAREVAAYSYAADRLADGENAVAETLLGLFDQKVVRDVAMTGLFYARCDQEILKQARVAQGFSGIWVNTEETGEKVRAEIYYRVKPANVLSEERGNFYVMRLVYRNWTGEGGTNKENPQETEDGKVTVYMTEHGKVYHIDKRCTYIKIDVSEVTSEQVGTKRNSSGAKYYACEFCSPVLKSGGKVYITEYGTRYHALSSCSAIKRNAKEYSLEEVEKTYNPCSKCGKKQEGENE